MVSFAEFDDDIAELTEEEPQGCCACCCPKTDLTEPKKKAWIHKKKQSVVMATETLQSLSDSMPEAEASIHPRFLPLTFVPDFVIAEIAEDSFRSLPYVLNSEAVLLIADVSGFTRLCESYCQKGVSGIEQLAAVLNGFMSTLTAMLISGGGDILKFAGDAFLVQWQENGDSGGLRRAVRRAYECAVALQTHQCLHTKNLDGTLKIKIGIAMGEVTTWVLGSPSEFLLFVVAGPTLPSVGKAEGLCSAGEIVVTDQIYGMLEELGCDTYRTTKLDGGFVKITDCGAPEHEMEPNPNRIRLFEACDPQHISMAKVFLIPSLRGIKSMNELEYVSELTMVTILFIALLNVEVSQPELMDICFDIILGQVKKHAGVLNKMVLFDKGCTFLVAFGLPSLKHSNDAARSILCSHDIVEKLATIDVEVSVGISSGTCFCGMVGHPQRQEFTVIGSHVNMAARIMVFYNDEPVALNAATYHLSRDELGYDNFIELPTRKMKGIDSPGVIYAYRKAYVVRRRSTSTFDSAEDSDIHGSEREKAKIRLCMAEMRDEARRRVARLKTLLPVLVVKGHSGSGKGYLLFYAIDAAVAAGYRYSVCCAIPSQSDEPFAVVARLLHRMLGMTMNETSFERERMILDSIPDPDWNSLYILNHLFNVHFPVRGMCPSEPHVRSAQFSKLAKAIVHEYCRKEYTVLAVNNAEHMDNHSWKLLHQLAEEERVLIALSLSMSFREDAGSTTLLLKAYLHVNAEALEEDCFAPLLCWFLGVKAVHVNIFLYLREVTQGKAQLLKEISLSPSVSPYVDLVHLDGVGEERLKKEFYVDSLQALRDEQPMACDLKPGLDIRRANIPTNISDAVKDSLNNLTIQDRLLLKRATVLGEDFDLHELTAISEGVSRAEVLESAHHLLRHHIFHSVCTMEHRMDAAKKPVPTLSLRPSNVCLCFTVYLRAEEAHAGEPHWPVGPYHRLQFRTQEFRSCMVAYMTKEQLYSMRMEVADHLESQGRECATCKEKRAETTLIRSSAAKEVMSYGVELKKCSCLQQRPKLYSEISLLYTSMGMTYLPAYYKRKAAQAANILQHPVKALYYVRWAEARLSSAEESEGLVEVNEEESYFDPLVLEVSLAKTKAHSCLLLGDTYSAASYAFHAIQELGLEAACFHGAYKPADFKKVLPRLELLHSEYITKLIPAIAMSYMQVHMYRQAMHILQIEYVALKLYPIDFLQVLNHMTLSYQCQYRIGERDNLHQIENNIFRLCHDKLRKFEVLIDLTEIDGMGEAYRVIVLTNLSLARFARADSIASEAIKILQLITETPTLISMKILLFRVYFHLKKYVGCAKLLRELEASAFASERRTFRALHRCGLMELINKEPDGFRPPGPAAETCNLYASQWTTVFSQVLPKDIAFYVCASVATWSLYSSEVCSWPEGDRIFRSCMASADDVRRIMDTRSGNYWTTSAAVMLARLKVKTVCEKMAGFDTNASVVREELIRLKKEVKASYPLYLDDVKDLLQELDKMTPHS